MQMSLLMRLGKTPTRELIEHLKDAVASRRPDGPWCSHQAVRR
jgi:hypothetical protein